MSTSNYSITLPPIAVLATAAADLVLEAADAGNTPRVNALNKAAYHMHAGLEVTLTIGAILVPSGTRGGVIHRVDHLRGCSCEAGRKGAVCWHAMLVEVIEQAQMRAIPMPQRLSAARSAGYVKAMVEIDELF